MKPSLYAGALAAALFTAGGAFAAATQSAPDAGGPAPDGWQVAEQQMKKEGGVGAHEPTSTGPERTDPSQVEETTGSDAAPTATTDEEERVPTTTGPERTDPSQVGR
jgi:hypothetical protein